MVEANSLWGPREEGGLFDPERGPFEQGSVRADFADRFGEVDQSKITELDLMGTRVRAIKRPDGSAVIVGTAPSLLKDPKEGGDIDAMSKLLQRQGGGIVYAGSLRSRRWDPSPFPNVAFHDGVFDEDGKLPVVDGFSGQEGAMNHFAVHSPELNDEYLDELGQRKKILETRGQILIVSLLATPFEGARTTMEAYLGDWETLVRKMAQAGIKYIDLNFANPHIPLSSANACEGTQFRLPEMAGRIAALCRHIVNEIDPEIKIGVNLRHVHTKADHDVLDENLMREWVDQVAPHINFITASNTDPTELLPGDETSSFAKVHPIAGISGRPLHAKALNLVEFLTRYRREKGYEYKVLATGGAVDPETIQNFVDAEVDAVLSVTGLYRNAELFEDYADSE